MASPQTASSDSSAANDEGSVEGRMYENLSLLLLAKNGYELSKDNAKFRDFSIGREINLGKDMKFDDNVFRYTEEGGSKNFIFVQVKHIQKDHRIDSRDLSVGAARTKRGKGLGKSREFNLQKYFISFLSVREELGSATSEELKNGVIKYVAIFTNASLDTEELVSKGFSLREAPEDIVKLFAVKSPEAKDFYQICNVSEHLHDVLMKSSDLLRLARELAPYVVWKSHREKNIMKNDVSPLKHYHVPLAREVIRKSAQSAQFREDFLENDETNSKQELRSALFEAIRELDASKKSFSDDKLKKLLKGIKWKMDPNFGEAAEDEETNFPSEWKTVKEEDIKDFLKCLVLIVNRPKVQDLLALILRSVQDTMVNRNYSTSLKYSTSLCDIVDKLDKTFPELKEHVEQDLGIYEATNFEEGWTSGEEIVKLIEKQKQQIGVSFFATGMTLMYESEIMQFGKFKETQKIEKSLDIFFSSSAQILCINSPQTLLSSIKILQYLSSKHNCMAEDGRIYANFDILKSKENRDSLASAFGLERNVLLVIEHRHAVSKQDVEEFYKKVCSVVSAKPNKKIIITIPKDEKDNLQEKFKNDLQNKNNFMCEYDVIDVTDFEPKEDPFKKEVILFQGQDRRISLCDITGIASWASYVESFSHGTNRDGVMDGMTLVKILTNDEMEVGSKPEGTSTLEGAYAQMYEEIDVETLVHRLTSHEHGHDANDVYVISGISGSSKLDKKNKLIQYLGLSNSKEKIQDQLGDVGSDGKIQITHGQFKHKDFQSLCRRFPKKRIFWISVKWENDVMKLILQETYNPNFYLKRKFRNVIIKKDLKENLIKEDLSETFIFHCVEHKQGFYKLMELNEAEKKQFENNRKIGIFSQKSDAEDTFRQLCGQKETIHSLKVKENELVWCESHGSVQCLQKYIDYKQSENFLIEEDKLITKIKDKKAVIFADDPGMGKTTTLINLYETELEPSSIIQSHWVINIKLKDHLETLSDHEFEKGGIGTLDVIQFLSNIDSELNNNLAKNLLKIVLDKSKNFQAKPLLLIFDGFDEVLDEKVRRGILLLIQFIKDETAAKLWITTRCHFKELLEEKLSTIAFQFSPMDDSEKVRYIIIYLQNRLYLTLNKNKYTELFHTDEEKKNKEKVHIYIAAFINKMKSIFRGDIETFIGTPLQLYLILEGAVEDFKNWIEGEGGPIPDLKYIGNDVFKVYENFVKRKYDVYFQKRGYQQIVQERFEKPNFDRYHKDIAAFKILEATPDDDIEELKDLLLLVGIIKSQGNDMEFIHKTFEEFYASKVLIDWITKSTETENKKKLLSEILIKPYYRLVRTFMNVQLQRIPEQAIKIERLKELGNIAAILLNEKPSPLIDKDEQTPLHIAVQEGNKDIACLLLNILKGQPNVLKNFLFIPKPDYNTALHLACMREDLQIVKALLNSAAGISNDTLQESIAKTLPTAQMFNKNIEVCKELLGKADSKLDLVIYRPFFSQQSALCSACLQGRENFVDLYLQEFINDKPSLEKLLLCNDRAMSNALGCARSKTTVEKLVSAAKTMEDNNATLKKLLLLPNEGKLPFEMIVSHAEYDVVEKVLEVAKEIDEDTVKQLLLNDRYGTGPSALHVADKKGRVNIMKLLLETALALGIEMLEELITVFDEQGKNALQVMFEHGHEAIFEDFLKIFEKDEYKTIRKQALEMIDTVLKSRLYWYKQKLFEAIELNDIKKIKDILSEVKNFRKVSRRILLLSDKYFEKNTLHAACERGNGETIKELLSCAKDIDDDNSTLKQLLFSKTSRESALHILAKKGDANIIQVLLEVADLDIEMLVELITAVDKQGKNAIQLMIDYDHEAPVEAFLKIFEKDEYQKIRKKVLQMIDTARLERRLYCYKQKLFEAIEHNDIKKVKDILSEVKNFIEESRRNLLLSDEYFEKNTLYVFLKSLVFIACKRGNGETVKELLSYAKEIDADNHTLKQLLLDERFKESALHAAADGHFGVTKLLLQTALDIGDDKHTLKQLLLRKGYEGSALNVAARWGHSDIAQLLLETASLLDDNKHTLKQLLLGEGYGDSALHYAARGGHSDIAQLLLETASSHLGTEILEKLIFDVNAKGENAVQLMAKHVRKTNFEKYFRMLRDEHPIIWEKVMDMYDNIPLELRLRWDKENMIEAISKGDIHKVKDILSNAKKSSINPDEILQILLLSEYEQKLTACKKNYTEIIKELLSYAMNIDDGGASLTKILTKSPYISKARKHRYKREIKQILQDLIVEARNNNRDHAVDILQRFKSQYF